MAQWEHGEHRWYGLRRASVIITAGSAAGALLVMLALWPAIEEANAGSSLIINSMYAPALGIGFLYGHKLARQAVTPGASNGPVRRAIAKIFLFIFVMGGMLGSVAFALNGGSVAPDASILADGLLEWASEYVSANGGATFLIVSSIMLMAAATRRIIGTAGRLDPLFAAVATFIFVAMLALSLTGQDVADSEAYLYTFYQAGIVGGVLFEMNRLTGPSNMWEDYNNGY